MGKSRCGRLGGKRMSMTHKENETFERMLCITFLTHFQCGISPCEYYGLATSRNNKKWSSLVKMATKTHYRTHRMHTMH